VKRGCDLLIVLLIHNVSNTQKKPPEQAVKGKFRSGFPANAPIIRTVSRAVKSTLAMLLIGDSIASP
jgi:hypothetical protein